jgi:hypothetical protein
MFISFITATVFLSTKMLPHTDDSLISRAIKVSINGEYFARRQSGSNHDPEIHGIGNFPVTRPTFSLISALCSPSYPVDLLSVDVTKGLVSCSWEASSKWGNSLSPYWQARALAAKSGLEFGALFETTDWRSYLPLSLPAGDYWNTNIVERKFYGVRYETHVSRIAARKNNETVC